jgi:hypothetical protein
MATNMVSKNKLGLRLTKDAFNAALNASDLEDATRMEDRNQVFLMVSGILEGRTELGEQ